jgi:divalent metal cation (Fe/Co/Zn/Cd) transporter
VRDFELEGKAPGHLRDGVRVSTVSIGWTVVSSTTSVALGLAAGSLVLVAFGLVGILDVVGSVALFVHFRHALRHDAFSERHERLALRIVTIGLLVVGAYTAIESVRRLVGHELTRPVPAGVALAAVSAGALGALFVAKRRIAGRIPSRALLADGWLSATGCLLAVVTVGGTGLTSAFDLRWADPLAALAIGCVAMVMAVVMASSRPRPRRR